MTMAGGGGYDDGYAACPCFWGSEPGSLVSRLLTRLQTVVGLDVLDAGCGEGKNAFVFARMGARVEAIDCSALALRNARALPDAEGVTWRHADVRDLAWAPETFDIVVAYGLLHCLRDRTQVEAVVSRLRTATRPGGWHVACAFNSRRQDLDGHPGFEPCLLDHDVILGLYGGWTIEEASDRDLHEAHPHNGVPHVHSLTRLIARRPTQ